MPKSRAAFATSTPMAPRPMTPRVFPAISGPMNCFLPASTAFSTFSLSVRVCTHCAPLMMRREDTKRPASTSSFTALALAPGVLNTGIPISVHLSMGMLLVPAPARATPSKLSLSSMLCMSKLRRMMPSGRAASGSMRNSASGSLLRPA